MSVKARMTFLISIVFTVIILVSTYIIFKTSSEMLNKEAEIRMLEQLQRAEENVSLLLDNIVLETKFLSRDDMVNDYFNGKVILSDMNEYFDKLITEKNNNRPIYMDLFLMNLDGFIVSAAVDDAIGNVNGNKRWYFNHTAKTGITSTSDVITSQANQTQIVITLTPVIEENKIKGYFGLAIYASYFSSFLENFKINNNDYIIIDSDNNILSHHNESMIKKPFNVFFKNQEELFEFTELTINNESYSVIMKKLGFKDWKIISVLKNDEIYIKSKNLSIIFLKVGSLLIIVAIFMSFYIIDYVTKPIINITKSINKIIDEEDHYKDNMVKYIPNELMENSEESVEISDFKKAFIAFKNILDNSMKSFEIEQNILRTYIINVDKEIKNINNRNLEFISTLSHDIRTPLTLIKGYASGLGEMVKNDDRLIERFKLGIIESSNDLEYLVYDVLDFAYEVSDDHVYKKKEILAIDFIEKLVFETIQLYEDREIKLEIENFFYEILFIDVMQINRVVVNLINNSIKYSKANDEIILKIKNNKKSIGISVFDKGFGISIRNQQNIFEMFYSGENRGNTKGYGLGLYISNHIVRSHNTYIKCESELGVYTEMFFEIEYAQKK